MGVASMNETPVDLAAVQADDALLDMLGGNEAGRSTADAELPRVLVAWRRDVDAESIGELVDTDTAAAAISAARKPAARKHPVLGPVAAAAAVLVIAFSGVGLVAKSAQPDDQLWSLTKVLYADYTRSVEAMREASVALRDARAALDRGDLATARRAHVRAVVLLPRIDPEQRRAEVAEACRRLGRELAGY